MEKIVNNITGNVWLSRKVLMELLSSREAEAFELSSQMEINIIIDQWRVIESTQDQPALLKS